MRRKDRAMTELADMLNVLEQADYLYLALSDGGVPYVVPMNFGYALEQDVLYLYFHCAREGTKLDFIRRDPRAAFSACLSARIARGEGVVCNMTTYFESVCGSGILEELPPERAAEALGVVVGHYTDEPADFGVNKLRATIALRLRVTSLTGKRALPKPGAPWSLAPFLLRAKRATYAGSGAEADAPSRPQSHDLAYEEGALSYRDTYLGGRRFAGEEAVFRDNQPIWAMNYDGRVLDDRFSGDFLKAALRCAPEALPLRGPSRFERDGFVYTCETSGDADWFSGTEAICLDGKKLYEGRFSGGAIR